MALRAGLRIMAMSVSSRQLLQYAAVYCGLARAHLTGQQDKATARTHPIEQMRQCIPDGGRS